MGRKVYGGGGITPDEPLVYERLTPFEQKLARDRIPFEFAGAYIVQDGITPDTFGSFENFLNNFEVTDPILERCASFMKERDFEFTDEELGADRDYLKLAIKAELAGHLWNTGERYQVYITNDKSVKKVIELLPEAEMLASRIPPEDAFGKTGTDR
jgi:carboxyl-terminal processing protease